MTHFGFKEAGRPPLQNPFFRVEMQDAIQDHILVHRRLHLPLFFSAFCQSSPTVHRYPLFPWVEQDSERIIESQSTAILTPVQTHMYLQTFKETCGLLKIFVCLLRFFISPIRPSHPWNRPRNLISKAHICSH